MTHVSPETLAELRAHLRELTNEPPGWWQACSELRRSHDETARALLVDSLRAGTLDIATLKTVLFHADRDLSRTTGKEIGRRYGHTFAVHLSNMGWMHDARFGRMADALLGLLAERRTLDEVLDDQHELSGFVFVTLAAFLLDPTNYLPWIAAVHRSVDSLCPPLPRRTPNRAAYQMFLSRTHALTTSFDCPPHMVDQLLHGVSAV